MKKRTYLNEQMKKIIKYLHVNGPSTPHEISTSKEDGTSYVTVLKYLEILKTWGIVEEYQPNPDYTREQKSVGTVKNQTKRYSLVSFDNRDSISI